MPGADMQTTVFRLSGDDVKADVADASGWREAEFEGAAVPGVEQIELHTSSNGTMLLIRMHAGHSFPMHSGPDFAFCQIVSGRGSLGLPDGSTMSYTGPELFIFEPGTLHDWHGISEDTLLAIC